MYVPVPVQFVRFVQPEKLIPSVPSPVQFIRFTQLLKAWLLATALTPLQLNRFTQLVRVLLLLLILIPRIQYSAEVGVELYLSPYGLVNNNKLPGIPITVFVPAVFRLTSLALVHVPGLINMFV
jgi:hypothetical protein